MTVNLKRQETSSVSRTCFTYKVTLTVVLFFIISRNQCDFFSTAVPGAPDKPTVSSVTRNSMTVNWEEPEYDGGSPVTGYWLEMKDTTSKRWKRVNRDPIKAMTLGVSYKVTGLIEGSDYQFRVYAINAAGVGPASLPSDPVTARDPIGKPGNHSFFFFYPPAQSAMEKSRILMYTGFFQPLLVLQFPKSQTGLNHLWIWSGLPH